MSLRPAAQSVIGRRVVAPWQLRSSRAQWLPEEEYVIRDGIDRVSFVNSIVPKPRRVALEQSVDADKPVWRASNVGFGDRPVMDCGGGQWMQADALAGDFSGASGPAPFTAFVVNNWPGTAASRAILSFGANASLPHFFLERRNDGAINVAARDAAGGLLQQATGDVVSQAPAVYELFWNGADVTVLRDGASVGIDGVVMNLAACTFTRLTVGAFRRDTVGREFAREWAFVSLSTRVLSAPERRIARVSLQRRFGL